MTDEEVTSLAQRPLDELSDDELALVAERVRRCLPSAPLQPCARCHAVRDKRARPTHQDPDIEQLLNALST